MQPNIDGWGALMADKVLRDKIFTWNKPPELLDCKRLFNESISVHFLVLSVE